MKCLIRIKTTVNVHLRMVNHCYREVNVRVLSLGPRLLGRALGLVPLFPALQAGVSATSGSGPGSGRGSGTPSRLAVPVQRHGRNQSAGGGGAGKARGCGFCHAGLGSVVLLVDSNWSNFVLKSSLNNETDISSFSDSKTQTHGSIRGTL